MDTREMTKLKHYEKRGSLPFLCYWALNDGAFRLHV